MKAYRKELFFEIPTRRAFVNITSEIKQCLAESGIREGLLLCNAMHITASVFINDDESGLHHDMELWLEKLAPEKPYSQYRHNGWKEIGSCKPKDSLFLSFENIPDYKLFLVYGEGHYLEQMQRPFIINHDTLEYY